LKSNKASTAAAAADVAMEASNHKVRKLERELKKLDSSWNPIDKTATDAPIVIETEDDGKEKAMGAHFVFNAELMNELGDPKTFEEAMERPDAATWLTASGNECVNFINRESWRKKLQSEVRQEGARSLVLSGCAKSRTNRTDRHGARDKLLVWDTCKSQVLIAPNGFLLLEMTHRCASSLD
jgi:hypothetical protein